ncbi:MAG: OB-fold protein, partial [Cetobacterium sp.]
YKGNELRFNKLYRGKSIESSGTVSTITQTFGKTYITLTNKYILTAHPSQEEKAINLNKGDKIKFSGNIGVVSIFGTELFVEKAIFVVK